MAYIGMACIVMATKINSYVKVMAYILMAYGVEAPKIDPCVKVMAYILWRMELRHQRSTHA